MLLPVVAYVVGVAHFRPVAVDESTVRTWLAEPAVSPPSVLSAVPTRRSPLALMVFMSALKGEAPTSIQFVP